MIVRELVALMGIKTDKKGFDNASGGMNRLIGLAKTAAAAFAGLKIIQWLKGTVSQIAETGDWLDKMSKRTGLAADLLQRFGHAAELSGASLDEVENALKKLQVAQMDAEAGLKTYKREFDRMGIDVRDANGNIKSTEQLLYEISDGMQGLESDSERTSVAVKLLGRAGARLIPLLKDGSANLRAMMQEVDELGALLDQELIDQSAEYIDNQQRMNLVWMSAKAVIGKQLLPYLLKAQEAIIGWWKANRKWIALKVENIFKNVARVSKNVVRAIIGIVRSVVSWYKELGPVPKKVLKIGAAIASIAGMLEAGVLGKILLIIGAIAMLIDDFMVWREGGKSAIGDVIHWFEDLIGIQIEDKLKEWTSSFGAFGSAMKASFVDATTAMKNSFFGFIDSSIGRLLSITAAIGFVKDIFTGKLDGMGQSFVNFVSNITSSFWGFVSAVGGFLSDMGSSFATWFSAIFGSFTKWLTDMESKFRSFVRFVKGIVGVSPAKTAEERTKAPGVAGPEPGTRRIQTMPGKWVTIKSPTSKVAAPQTNVNVNVKATPGMDEKKLAGEVARQVGNAVERQNRAAMAALSSS